MTDDERFQHRVQALEADVRRLRDEIPTVEDLSNHRNLVEFRKWTREEIAGLRTELANLRAQIVAIRGLQAKRALRLAAIEEDVKAAASAATRANTWINVTVASIGGATGVVLFMVGLWYLISLTIIPLFLPK